MIRKNMYSHMFCSTFTTSENKVTFVTRKLLPESRNWFHRQKHHMWIRVRILSKRDTCSTFISRGRSSRVLKLSRNTKSTRRKNSSRMPRGCGSSRLFTMFSNN
ncbi:hypothetical protein CEXT_610231 [Caerostris extrusa]|uniref:Uncharacterized protein n=1 Tax=Caerostris extrusa TaxID=172846 RepID=A0AAV4Y1S7_CAEEX|nr:hypothetical protein CEXT_610231 [Caerostris extrusa]